jgi:hypothetical protein
MQIRLVSKKFDADVGINDSSFIVSSNSIRNWVEKNWSLSIEPFYVTNLRDNFGKSYSQYIAGSNRFSRDELRVLRNRRTARKFNDAAISGHDFSEKLSLLSNFLTQDESAKLSPFELGFVIS